MDIEEEKALYKQAQIKWGFQFQRNLCIEDCSELIQELVKFGREINGSTVQSIAEEIADVKIMLGQMEMMFHNSDLVKEAKERKLKRLAELLDNEFKR